MALLSLVRMMIVWKVAVALNIEFKNFLFYLQESTRRQLEQLRIKLAGIICCLLLVCLPQFLYWREKQEECLFSLYLQERNYLLPNFEIIIKIRSMFTKAKIWNKSFCSMTEAVPASFPSFSVLGSCCRQLM